MVVSVLFPQRTAETDADAIGRLQRLAPHLLRVAQLNRQLAGLEARAVMAEAFLEGLATAMWVVSDGGRVVYMNATAERIIAHGDGPTMTSAALGAVYPSDGRASPLRRRDPVRRTRRRQQSVLMRGQNATRA
jgi:hypothetical protein